MESYIKLDLYIHLSIVHLCSCMQWSQSIVKILHVPLDDQQGNCWTVVIYNENDGDGDDVPLDSDDNFK